MLKTDITYICHCAPKEKMVENRWHRKFWDWSSFFPKSSLFHNIQSEFQNIIWYFFFTFLTQVISVPMIWIWWYYDRLYKTTILVDIYWPQIKTISHREFSTLTNYRTNLIVRWLSPCLQSRNSLTICFLFGFVCSPSPRYSIHLNVVKNLQSES